jgi:hypothetical protein
MAVHARVDGLPYLAAAARSEYLNESVRTDQIPRARHEVHCNAKSPTNAPKTKRNGPNVSDYFATQLHVQIAPGGIGEPQGAVPDVETPGEYTGGEYVGGEYVGVSYVGGR